MAANQKKKKKRGKWIAIVIVAVVVIFIVVANLMGGGPAVEMVTTKVATIGSVESRIGTSGTVISDETKVYYAVTGVTIDAINVQVGDAVSAGEQLITFDEDAITLAISENNLQLASTDSDYLSRISSNNENRTEYAEASASVNALEALIEEKEDYIDGLESGIESEREERMEEIYYEMESIDITILSLRREMSKLTQPMDDDEIDYYNKQIMEYQMRLEQLQTESNLLQNFEASDNKDELLEIAQADLADLKADLAEAKAERDAADAAILSSYSVEALTATNDLNALRAAEALRKLEEAQGGIVADFDGIVTEIAVNEGATVMEGALLIKIEASEQVSVRFGASKYDLETLAVGQSVDVTIAGNIYEGEVSRINRMATTNSNGSATVNAEVSILNPDENIYLGMDAKLSILTAQSDAALVVPVEAVNTDRTGDFCYVVEDGVAHIRYVTTGISSNTEIEILSGIDEGDVVITLMTSNLADGVAVVDINELMPATNEDTQEQETEEE